MTEATEANGLFTCPQLSLAIAGLIDGSPSDLSLATFTRLGIDSYISGKSSKSDLCDIVGIDTVEKGGRDAGFEHEMDRLNAHTGTNRPCMGDSSGGQQDILDGEGGVR